MIYPRVQIGPVTLSTKYARIIALVAEGHRNKDIATAVGTTEHCIKNCLHFIFDQTGMSNRTELALWYVYHSEKEKQNGKHTQD